MSWVRIDDSFCFASTTVAAGNRAVGALVRLMAWACEDRSDGFVPTGIVQMIASNSDVTRLVATGLAERVNGGERRVVGGRSGRRPDVQVQMPGAGLFLPTFLETNLSRAEGVVLAERGRKGGEASGRSRRGEPQVQQEVEQQVQPQVKQYRTVPNRTEENLQSLLGRNGREPRDRDALDPFGKAPSAAAPASGDDRFRGSDVAAHDAEEISDAGGPS
jgi:hypothetical protein